ncbi:MAG: hypothetical protein Q9201_000108 [Fulgogasparrea decipioides]
MMALSKTYNTFCDPIRNGDRASFDVHVYFHQDDEEEIRFMKCFREAITQEFPELTFYKIHYAPIGPHPIGMFEVDIFTPAQFGALVPWLAIHHGPLSVLIHTNTGDGLRDHTKNAIWIGEKLPLNLASFPRFTDLDETTKKLEHLMGGEV